MIEPLEDYMVLALVREQESKIAIPDSVDPTKNESAIFEVKAIGPGYLNEISGVFVQPPVSVGDKVILAGYSLARIKYKSEDVIVAKARDVALRVKDEVQK